MAKDSKSECDYTPNDVQVVPDTLLHGVVDTNLLSGCPCYHHQAIESVEGTNLRVSAYTITNGITMIEAVERTDKPFALGLQFHPEMTVSLFEENELNREIFMSSEMVQRIFESIALPGTAG